MKKSIPERDVKDVNEPEIERLANQIERCQGNSEAQLPVAEEATTKMKSTCHRRRHAEGGINLLREK